MKILSVILCLSLLLISCTPTSSPSISVETSSVETSSAETSSQQAFSLENIPPFDGETAFVPINDNVPFFTKEDLTTTSYEKYSPLDNLKRCGVAMACVGRDIMPTQDRESIGQVKPSGWQTVKYDVVEGKYLYNRCHLIGFQLTGENANEKNLITGTRYLNIEGMLPFENMIADYVKEENGHVLYRVTPIFEDDNLVASGVLLEGFSVEDNGEAICFNVYAYNAQPQITINYKNGSSQFTPNQTASETDNSVKEYVLNTNSKKIHKPTCSGVSGISDKNRKTVTSSRDELINSGYIPCKICNP